jgi:hypothetical protein
MDRWRDDGYRSWLSGMVYSSGFNLAEASQQKTGGMMSPGQILNYTAVPAVIISLAAYGMYPQGLQLGIGFLIAASAVDIINDLFL